MSSSLEQLKAIVAAAEQAARDAQAEYAAAQAEQEAAEARRAAQQKALPHIKTEAAAITADAIHNETRSDIRLPDRWRVRHEQEGEQVSAAATGVLKEPLNIGGALALDVFESTGMKGLAKFWGLEYSEAFTRMTAYSMYQALRSLECEGGRMRKHAYEQLQPIALELIAMQRLAS